MAVTIEQIAARAGVSRGTVDRALNHRGRIRPEVAERIEQIADELGYISRRQKRMTAQGYQKTIGVITQLSGSSFMLAVNRGIHDESRKLEKQGIRVLLREGAGVDAHEQLQLLDGLLQEGIDALALMPVDCEEVRERLRQLTLGRGMPVVTFNSDIAGTGRACFVGLDNRQSGRAAAGLMGTMLHGQGKVLGITGSFSNSAGSRRIDGFVQELKTAFPQMELVGIQSSFDRTEQVESCILQAMSAYPDLAGILVVSGGQAGVKRAFEKLQPKCRPFVILYDLTPKNARLLQEGIADFLIDQDGYTQGYRAVSLLADKLRWNKDPDREYMYTGIDIKTKYNL